MRANEFITELFQPREKSWDWNFRGSEEAVADFKVGNVPYRFHAYNSGDKDWEVEFKHDTQEKTVGRKARFGLTGTGNSAEVMSTIVGIMREFFDYYKGNIDSITFTAKEPSRQKLYMRMMKRLLPDWTISTYDEGGGLGFTVVAPDIISEVFEPGKTNWNWLRRSEDDARAHFVVGDREYIWDAFSHRANPKKWEIQFRLVRNQNDPDNLDLFGTTGTGNSAEVMSTAVDITRSFLQYYGLENVEEITFNAKEDSRIALYAKMIKRLLPGWDLHSRKHPQDGMLFTLTDRRAYDKPENKLSEELVDEGFVDTLKKGAAAGAIALGALGAGNADAKVNHPVMKPGTYQKVDKAAKPAEKETGTYNALSNNLNNEITVHKAAKKAGLRGAELAQFLAQMKHESWDFGRLKEKSQPGVKGYFAKRYDIKYSPRTAKILGNMKPGDGERYHGRGFVQLTGRDNYRMASEALGIDLLSKPELAANPEVAAKVAVWYWKTRVKPFVNNFADTASVTKRINPALRGVDDRHENFKDYMRII